MKRLYATTDLTEAELLRALLRDQGIESSLDNTGGAALAVGLPTAAVPIGINVSDEDAPAAVEALARHFEKENAEEMEADPDAPPPLTPEESARFEAKVKRVRFWRRFFLLLVFFFPAILGLVVSFSELWQMAAAGTAGVFSLVALIWVVDLIAESRESKADPPPVSGDGPAGRPS
jgi:hypothetical protein